MLVTLKGLRKVRGARGVPDPLNYLAGQTHGGEDSSLVDHLLCTAMLKIDLGVRLTTQSVMSSGHALVHKV